MTDENRTRTIDLSLPQLLAGSIAAATAAALSTRLGVVGTILGAVVASVTSMVVAATLDGWLRRAGALATAREPGRLRSVVVGLVAVGLVALAFHTGTELLLRDLPSDSLATRVLAEMGVTG